MQPSTEALNRNDEATEIVKVDHLISLVGGNPLPIAISAELLLKPEGLLTLIHSPNSSQVAKQLESVLKERISLQGITIDCREIDESNPAGIRKKFADVLSEDNADSTGLDYTGGTKAMAAHTYALFDRHFERTSKNTITSYLDARSHALRMEVLRDGGREQKQIFVANQVKFSLKEMMFLHNWWGDKAKYDTEPVLTVTAQMLARMFRDSEFATAWKEWLKKEVEPKCKKDNGDIKGRLALSEITLDLASENAMVQELFATLKNELHSNADGLSPLQEKTGTDPKSFCKWLFGEWLESAVASYLLAMQDLEFNEVAIDINTASPQFQLDLAAIRGHQAFFISCTTDDTRQLTKSKVFEIALRAKQLGGNEASFCLVCCSRTPSDLERELRNCLQDENVRVIGIDGFTDLEGRLRQWVEAEIKR